MENNNYDKLRAFRKRFLSLYDRGINLVGSNKGSDLLYVLNETESWKASISEEAKKIQDHFPNTLNILHSYLKDDSNNNYSYLNAITEIIDNINSAIDKIEGNAPVPTNRIMDGKLNFDEDEREFYIDRETKGKIKGDSIGFFICKLASVKRGAWVNDADILDEYEETVPGGYKKDACRPVYYAVRSLNEKVDKIAGIKKFFEYKDKRVRISHNNL